MDVSCKGQVLWGKIPKAKSNYLYGFGSLQCHKILKNTLDLLALFSSKQTYSFVFLTLKSSFRVNIWGNLTTSLTSQMLVWSIFCQKDKRKKNENADDKYCFWAKIITKTIEHLPSQYTILRGFTFIYEGEM